MILVRRDEDHMPPPGIPRNSSPATLGVWAERTRPKDQGSGYRRLFYMSSFEKQDRRIMGKKFLSRPSVPPCPGSVKYALGRGVVAEEASRIQCPLFWASARGRDPEPMDRAGRVPRALRRSPRCHHFETKRAEFWTRIHPWALWVASQVRSLPPTLKRLHAAVALSAARLTGRVSCHS